MNQEPTIQSDGPAEVPKLINRRRALALLAGGGAAALLAAACGSDDPSTSSTGTSGSDQATSGTGSASSSSSAQSGASGAPGRIPEETAGPYPGDGTNGPNALTVPGIARTDIRKSVGTGSATADGVPLSIELTMVDADSGKAVPGAAVYLWHCDRIGRYSMYSSGLSDENYLRGVQAADANGVLRFTSAFPGAYSGRWPHIHFHVFASQAEATTGRNARVTSQLALPELICRQVYATSGYESSAQNMARTSLSSDMVFRDGWDLEMATVTGSASAGYVAKLAVGI
jgi:protocatechuate 3,4-dioxygenase beta subunit